MPTKAKNKKKGNGPSVFTIVVSVVVVLMLIVVALAISSSKEEKADPAKIQVSNSVTVSPASVGDQSGQASLPPFDDAAQTGADAAVGQIVPQFTAQKFDGTRETVSPDGKPYVLIFLAHWCPNCQAEVPKLVKMSEEGSLPEEVEYYGVTTGTSSQQANYPPSRWLLRENWPWTTLLDSQRNEIGNAFGLSGYPFMVFVNEDGTVARRVSGQIPDEQFISLSQSLLGG